MAVFPLTPAAAGRVGRAVLPCCVFAADFPGRKLPSGEAQPFLLRVLRVLRVFRVLIVLFVRIVLLVLLVLSHLSQTAPLA